MASDHAVATFRAADGTAGPTYRSVPACYGQRAFFAWMSIYGKIRLESEV